jgi:hypothetical protein
VVQRLTPAARGLLWGACTLRGVTARPFVIGVIYTVHRGQETRFEATRSNAESAGLKFISGRINYGLFAWVSRHAKYVWREWCVEMALFARLV